MSLVRWHKFYKPFQLSLLGSKGEIFTLLLIFTLSGIVTIIHSFVIISKHKGLCFGLDFPPLKGERDYGSYVGILFSAVLISIDVVLLVITILLNTSSVYIIYKSGRQSGRKEIKYEEKIFMVRSILVSVSNFLSWSVVLPVTYTSLSGYHITSEVMDWIVIIGLPLNSLLNPVIYTFSTKLFKTYISQRCTQI